MKADLAEQDAGAVFARASWTWVSWLDGLQPTTFSQDTHVKDGQVWGFIGAWTCP